MATRREHLEAQAQCLRGQDERAAPARLFGRILRTLRVWRMRAVTRRELAGLDERLRRDVGLTRDQALEEARKPFWRE